MLRDILAAAFLALVAAAPLVWAAVAIRKSPYTCLQSILLFLAVLLVRILWRGTYPGRLPVPPGQGAVIVCNHRSSVDPFFIQVWAKRPVHWMVAREYCEHPALRWFLKTSEVIPVSRAGTDTAATKAAIRITSRGGLVGMLPEGRINMGSEFMLPGRPGAILVALKAKVPVLPCYIEGSPYNQTAWSPLLMRAKVTVRFGELIDLSPYWDQERDEHVLREQTIRCLKAIAHLAGRDDFQPQLAGRRWKPGQPATTAPLSP